MVSRNILDILQQNSDDFRANREEDSIEYMKECVKKCFDKEENSSDIEKCFKECLKIKSDDESTKLSSIVDEMYAQDPMYL